MANNGSFKEKIGDWVEKAGEYADVIRDKTNEYADKVEGFADKMGKKTASGVSEVRDNFVGSVNDLKNSAAEAVNKAQEDRSQVVHRTEEFENRADDSVKQVRSTAKNAKRDAAINREVIQRRADRFAEGVDNVAGDLKDLEGSGVAKKNHTHPIDSAGNYRAVDGSVHNLNDRLGVHTEKTQERIREDAFGDKGPKR